MKTCEYAGDVVVQTRSHPWVTSAGNDTFRYYDLRNSPVHIRTSLEDFTPWNQHPAVEIFYAMLERVNHLRSVIESNDCEFTGPHENSTAEIPKLLQCSGRIMVLFRALQRNTDEAILQSLKNELHRDLVALDSGFLWGMVGTTIVPVRYLQLPERQNGQLGWQLMISFWAWGDNEAEAFSNLGRLFTSLSEALGDLAGRSPAG